MELVDNQSKYSANSPSVILRFGIDDNSRMGLCAAQELMEEKDLPWKEIEFKTSGLAIIATQWDGGSEYPIHGHSIRRLPNLSFVLLYGDKGQREIDVELLAEGYRTVQKIEIEFTVEGEVQQQREKGDRLRVWRALRRRHSRS